MMSMTLKLFNTLTKQKEEFKTVIHGIVRMYNCGPTVYMTPHIGNYRAYLFADILKRYLKYKKYDVHQVQNITDVGHMTADQDMAHGGEDKLEKTARKEGKTPWQIAEYYASIFMKEIEILNIDKAIEYPRATEHINEMIQIIEELIRKGHAYIANGSVYYDVTSFPNYGAMTGNTVEKLLEGAGGRVDHNPDKKNHFDFALWVNDLSHIMGWKSPWCEKGYPGWHIECTAMSFRHLTQAFESEKESKRGGEKESKRGSEKESKKKSEKSGIKFVPEKFETIDIHTGGEDNVFPHHECEIAQSEGATNKKFCNFWMHTRHLLVDGKKMSKSKGNFYVLKDILNKGYSARMFRLAIISVNYRIPLNFTFEGMDAARKNIQKIDEFMEKIEEINNFKPETIVIEQAIDLLIRNAKKEFEEAMNDDLNISGAMAVMYFLMTEINKLISNNQVNRENAAKIHSLMMNFDKVLGVIEKTKIKIPQNIIELAQQRLKARKEKNWAVSDALRKKAHELGYQIDDIEEGYKVKKLH